MIKITFSYTKPVVVLVALILIVIIKFMHQRDLQRAEPGWTSEEVGPDVARAEDEPTDKKEVLEDQGGDDEIRLAPVSSKR